MLLSVLDCNIMFTGNAVLPSTLLRLSNTPRLPRGILNGLSREVMDGPKLMPDVVEILRIMLKSCKLNILKSAL